MLLEVRAYLSSTKSRAWFWASVIDGAELVEDKGLRNKLEYLFWSE